MGVNPHRAAKTNPINDQFGNFHPNWVLSCGHFVQFSVFAITETLL
jgi:hypothetical protein